MPDERWDSHEIWAEKVKREGDRKPPKRADGSVDQGWDPYEVWRTRVKRS